MSVTIPLYFKWLLKRLLTNMNFLWPKKKFPKEVFDVTSNIRVYWVSPQWECWASHQRLNGRQSTSSGSSLSRAGSGLRRDQQVDHSKSGERVIQEREGQDAAGAHERDVAEAVEVMGIMNDRASWMSSVCTWRESRGERSGADSDVGLVRQVEKSVSIPRKQPRDIM